MNSSVLTMVNDTCEGEFDWSGELIPVQGFGYMPPCVDTEMERRFQVSTDKLVPVKGIGFITPCVDREMGRSF